MTRLLGRLGVTLALAALWLWGEVEAEWQAAKRVPVALCPHVTTIVHIPTPWQAQHGRKTRTEHLTPTEGC